MISKSNQTCPNIQCSGRVSAYRSGGLGFEYAQTQDTPKTLKMVLNAPLCNAPQIKNKSK